MIVRVVTGFLDGFIELVMAASRAVCGSWFTFCCRASSATIEDYTPINGQELTN